MSGDLVAFVNARLDEDERSATTDERHWADVPDAVFSSTRLLTEVASKRKVLAFLRAASDPAWATYAVAGEAREALKAMALPFADHPDYRAEWAP